MHALFALLLVPFGALHFLPTIVALLRGARHTFGIFVINLLFGWTVVGWVVAMLLALRPADRYARVPYGYASYGVGGYPYGWRRF